MKKTLQIYNSLTRTKAPFQPIEEGKVRMYVCGMTVYDYCHIGHARVLVVFDVVSRYLRELDYDVTYVRNITDIDDKIINRANEGGEDYVELTGRFIDEMNRDADALGVLRPDSEPRATLYMDQIIDMIQSLVNKKYAYAADNGDVYYDVSRFDHYGELSGRQLDELRAGERVEIDEAKDDPLDFVLWKSAKPGEPKWKSPWGDGRPGWHIECSAMSTHCLGNHFDIHGGGRDLQFPHHENEIAQSEAATGEKFVNVWMHNGFVEIDEEKMSKSLGNFFTVREVLKKYKPEEVRYFILSSHYRSPLNYSDVNLNEARAALSRLYTALRGIPASKDIEVNNYTERFHDAMCDDFNTREAISVLFEIAKDINIARKDDEQKAVRLGALLRKLGAILGLLQQKPEVYLQEDVETGDRVESDIKYGNKHLEKLIKQREDARKKGNWAESDRIRDELAAQGIILEDSAEGTTWHRE